MGGTAVKMTGGPPSLRPPRNDSGETSPSPVMALPPSLPPPLPLRRETTLEDVEEEGGKSFHPRSLKSKNTLQFLFQGS